MFLLFGWMAYTLPLILAGVVWIALFGMDQDGDGRVTWRDVRAGWRRAVDEKFVPEKSKAMLVQNDEKSDDEEVRPADIQQAFMRFQSDVNAKSLAAVERERGAEKFNATMLKSFFGKVKEKFRKVIKCEHKGGTHASPRLHDRRGHSRRLPDGRIVWVRPCKVGDASRGVVFHDYQVKEQK